VSTIIELVNQGKAYRVVAILDEKSIELEATLAAYDGLEEEREENALRRMIQSGAYDYVEWPDKFGEKPGPDDDELGVLEAVREEQDVKAAGILDALVAILRTEG
jgi:hypothetical protein